jgi:hypothetical protein
MLRGFLRESGGLTPSVIFGEERASQGHVIAAIAAF